MTGLSADGSGGGMGLLLGWGALWAALVFVLLAVLFTWPLAADLTGTIPGGCTDVWQNYWGFWWWHHALFELGQSPLWTDLLYYPFGSNLALHTHSAFNMLWTMPFQTVWGPAAAMNLATLGALAGCGWTAYLLARDLGLSWSGAILAGIVFTLNANHMEQTLEHLNLISAQFMPLAVLFLLRWLRTARWEWAVGLGLSFGFQALASWHIGLLTGMLLLLLALIHCLTLPRVGWAFPAPKRIGHVVIGLLAMVIVAGPMLFPMVREILAGVDYVKPAEERGIDLLFLMIPSERHPIWGGLTRGVYAGLRAYLSVGFVCFVGVVPLICVGAGLFGPAGRRRVVWGWCAALVVLLVLAMGANPVIAGRSAPGGGYWPFAWLGDIPVVRAMRLANRFMVPMTLVLGILAGLGLDLLAAGRSVRGELAAGGLQRSARRGWLSGLVIALVLIEYAWVPYPVVEVPKLEWARAIRDEPGGGAVLSLPFDLTSATVMNLVEQTEHRRPIAGGYIAVPPERVLKLLQGDRLLGHMQGFQPDPGWAPATVDELRAGGYGWVVLHPGRTRERLAARLGSVRAAGGDFYEQRRWIPARGLPEDWALGLHDWFEMELGAPWYMDEEVSVFRVPDEGAER